MDRVDLQLVKDYPMFFTVYVLFALKLFKLKIEGQTI